jgi:hypothetical protein
MANTPDERAHAARVAAGREMLRTAVKARVIEEMARALRPGGRALLQIGERGWEYAAGTATDPVMLTAPPCRLLVHRDLDLELVPLEDHLAAVGGERFTIRVPRGRGT